MAAASDDGGLKKLAEELGRISDQLVRLEDRVGELEERGVAGPRPLIAPAQEAGGQAGAVQLEAATDAATPGHSSVILGRVAVICFVLIGALVLRVISRAGIIAPTLGTILGLVYCTALLGVPFLLRQKRLAPGLAPVLEICGAVLAASIVLESTHRGGPIGTLHGAVVLAALALAVSALAWFQKIPLLLAVGHLAVLAGCVALSLTSEALLLRGGTALALTGIALLAARRLQHPWLRPAAVLPVMAASGLALLMVAKRPGVPPETIALLMGLCLALWLMTALQALLSAEEPRGFERAQFPLVTLWAAILGLHVYPAPAAMGGLVLALALLAGLAARKQFAKRQELLTMCAWLPLISAPWIDPTGLTLAVLALVLLRLGIKEELPRARVLSHFLLLAAVIVCLGGTEISAELGQRLFAVQMGAAALLTLLAGLHFAGDLSAARRGGALPGWLPILPMTACGITLLSSARQVALFLLGEGATYNLAQTIILAAATVSVMFIARGLSFRPGGGVALAMTALLGMKVLLRDLFSLEGLPLLFSVLALGVTAGIISLLLRSEAWRALGSKN